MKTVTALKATPDPRAELACRITARERAAAALLQAAEALERARQAVMEAEAIVGNFSDLEERIAATRAEMVKRGDKGELPPDLIRQRKERRKALERLAEQAGALGVLEREHSDAKKTARNAEEAVVLEAHRTILREAAGMADELMEAKQRSWSLAHRLLALDQTIGISLLPEQLLAIRMGMHAEHTRIMSAVNAIEPMYVAVSPMEPQAIARKKWKQIHAALVADANAPIAWE